MKGAVSWFANNHVAANLLMGLVLFGGILVLPTLRQEVFPEFSSDQISISVAYLGAAPEEVEHAVNQRIEERIQDLQGIDRIRSTASEGRGTVMVEVEPGADAARLLDDIKSRVDAIDTFPAETEQPVVQEVIIRRRVVDVAIHGELEGIALKRLGERVRDEIAVLPGISLVELAATPPYEIAVEVSEDALRRYGLTFDEVAQAVRRGSLDLPGGSIRTDGGEVLLRTTGQARRGGEFERLPLVARPDGTRILLGDVAAVVDGFAETDQWARFDGQPAVLVQVFRVGDQSALEVSAAVHGYVERLRAELPAGVGVTIWQDDSTILRSRLDLLLGNGRVGLLLVLLVLAVFLRVRLAGWVALGIPISFLGAIALMPTFDVSVNLISLFAFIVVLGIVVDDAIVVGENIYRHLEQGKPPLRAAIDGAHEVAVPVTFSILTTVAAFAPMLMVEGNTGKIMAVIPTIVISVLAFSLLESLFVLPAHLGHRKRGSFTRDDRASRNPWTRFQRQVERGLRWVVSRLYAPSLEWALSWRYSVVAIGLVMLTLTMALTIGGHIRFTFFPNVEADFVGAFVTMPQGTPADVTAGTVRRLEREALALRDELPPGSFRHVLTSIGDQPFRTAQAQNGGDAGSSFSGAHLGEVTIELAPAEAREVVSEDIANRWRERVGAIPDATELTFNASIFSTGEDINVQFTGPSLLALESASADLKAQLATYPGVRDVTDSFRAGKPELDLDVTPAAEALGISLSDLGRQVRQAFYGEEAQRVQRGREDVRVMVRYPASERRSIGNLETMRIRTPSGAEVPFSVVGRVEPGRGYAAIARTDRNRSINVTADVDDATANANAIAADLEARVLPAIMARHPSLRYTFEGQREEQRETMTGLARGFALALFVIYALLAIPFKSYLQPVIVMSAIPFGLIGAIWGHVVMGMDLTVLSMFGIVALTGVVVNDSLVMVDFINRHVRDGMSVAAAIRTAGVQRFRPILLTSLTTFAGLTPLLLERSVQAQFLIPMAVSLAFGVIFATAVTLLLVPVGYLILEDLHGLVRRSTPDADRGPAGLPEGSA